MRSNDKQVYGSAIRCLMLCFLTGVIWAYAPPAYAGEGSGLGYITELYVPATGAMVMVRFSAPIKNPGNCGGTEFYVKELDDSRSSTRYLAILSSAFFDKKMVYFYIEGCTRGEHWGKTRPQLFDVYVQNEPLVTAPTPAEKMQK
jgi:hypothetical protein